MAGIEAELPVGLTVDKIADQPVVVEHSIHEFVKSFAEALGIVLLVSFLSLGLRTGMVVALSVPLVLAIVFFVMSLMGMDLNRITLGALIIALGLLVDDAIIAIEMMVVKTEAGLGPGAGGGCGLGHHRLPDADRHAGDGGGLHPGRLRRLGGGGIRRRHLLGGGDRADRLVVRGGDLHAVSRGDAAAARSRRRRTIPMAAATYRVLRAAIDACLRHRRKVVGGDGGDLRGGDRRLRQRAAAVLPDLGAAGAVPADQAAGGVVDHRDDGGGRGGRGPARGRRRT